MASVSGVLGAAPGHAVVRGVDKAGNLGGVVRTANLECVAGQYQRTVVQTLHRAGAYAVELHRAGCAANLGVQNGGVGPGLAAVLRGHQPQIGGVTHMQAGIIEEHILMHPGICTKLLAIELHFICAVVEIVMAVHKVAALLIVGLVQEGRIAIGKIAHVISIIAVRLVAGAGVNGHPLYAVDAHKASRLVGPVRRSVDGKAAGEQIDQQIERPILAHCHERVNKGGRVRLFRVCAVVEVVGEIVVPGFAVVVGVADNGVNAAGVHDVTPACVTGRY